jgi:hypothetical protein
MPLYRIQEHDTKVHFCTWTRANKAARWLRRRHEMPFGPYRCFCGAWMVGSGLRERAR